METVYLMDIDDEFSVERTYNSPYFSDYDDIENDSTGEVLFPDTEKNKSVLEYIDRPDTASNIPYETLKAHYYIGGMTVFEDADVYILDYSDGYFSMQFTFGVTKEKYLPLFETYLHELEGYDEDEWIADWNQSTIDSYYPFDPDVIYLLTTKFMFIDYTSVERTSDVIVDSNGDITAKYIAPEPYDTEYKYMSMHPYVPAINIINLIEEINNVDFSSTPGFDRFTERLENKGIILSEYNEDDYLDSVTAITPYQFVAYNTIGSYLFFAIGSDQTSIDNYNILELYGSSKIIFDQYAQTFNSEFDVTVDSFTISCGVVAESQYSEGDIVGEQIGLRFYLVGYVTDTEEYEILAYGDTFYCDTAISSTRTTFTATFDIEDEVTIEQGDTLMVMIGQVDATGGEVQWLLLTSSDDVNINPHVISTFYAIESNTGNFNCIANMPQITQIEFIQQMLIHTGGFMGYDSDGNIKFYYLEELKNNLNNGVYYDWTGRISNVESTEYQFGDYAKSNYILFNNDDDLADDRKVTITVDNDNLDTESDLYNFTFDSASGDVGERAECVLYEQTVSVDTSDNTTTTFEHDFQGDYYYPFVYVKGREAINVNVVESEYYEIYEDVINKPQLKTVELNLGLYESANIDWTKPVYIGEWGRFCMIYSVECDDDGLATVELLVLNDI